MDLGIFTVRSGIITLKIKKIIQQLHTLDFCPRCISSILANPLFLCFVIFFFFFAQIVLFFHFHVAPPHETKMYKKRKLRRIEASPLGSARPHSLRVYCPLFA